MNTPNIYVISDSVGETAEFVVKAALSQFIYDGDYAIKRIPYVKKIETLSEIVRQAFDEGAIIAFTLVNPDFRKFLMNEATDNKVECVDIMGPMIEAMQRVYKKEPKLKPGLVHQLNEDYFKRVEAIEFAVKYDDGRDPRGISKADVILIGVSRTSKTPLSQHLAHKRLKVANVPIVPEVEPPNEIFHVDPYKCVGLKISPTKLNDIRKERLKTLGLGDQASYADMNRIEQELKHFEQLVERIGCPIIDVSNKAVEETANLVVNLIGNR